MELLGLFEGVSVGEGVIVLVMDLDIVRVLVGLREFVIVSDFVIVTDLVRDWVGVSE